LLFIYSLTSSVNLKSDAYCNRILPHTIICDRIRQSYSSVYGVQTVTFKSLHIFIRSPYTVSVSHRFTPYTVPVYDLRMSPFFTVNGRLRPCMFDLGDTVVHYAQHFEKFISFCFPDEQIWRKKRYNSSNYFQNFLDDYQTNNRS
jgi:hypothetical protein